MNKNNYILFKYLWILVIIPKEFQLIFFSILVIFLYNNIKMKRKGLHVLVISYLLFLVINSISGIRYFLIENGVPFERLIAMFNTICSGVIGCLLFSYYYNAKIEINYKKIKKYMLINVNIIMILSFIFFLIKYLGISFPQSVFQNTILFRSIWQEDWINGLYTIRFRSYLEYDELVIWFILLNGAGAVNYWIDKDKKLLAKLYLLLMLVPIYFSGGRTGTLVYILLMIFTLTKMVSSNYIKKLITSLLLVLAISASAFFGGKIVDLIYSLVQARGGSTSMRMYLYSESISRTFNESPFIGIGVKLLVSGFPLGSHSTYIGWLYRTGLLGMPIMLIFMIYLLKIVLSKWIINSKYWLAQSFIFASCLLMLTTDLDGANWVIILFFSNLGLLYRQQITDEEKYFFLKSY